MGNIQVTIETPGLVLEDCLIPDDYTPEQVVAEIVEELNLSGISEAGDVISYSLLYVDRNLPLPKGKLLVESGVQNGDTVRIVPSRSDTSGDFSSSNVPPSSGDSTQHGEVKVVLSVLDLNKTEIVVLPSDQAIGEIISSIAVDYGLPPRDKLGQLIKYLLRSKALGRFLSELDTLNQAGIPHFDRLYLHREEIAGCFPETAKVLLPAGDAIPIGELNSRDVVLAYDSHVGGYLHGEVEGIYQQTFSERLIINDLLVTTPDQHLYMADRSWRLASDITPGDVLLTFPFGETAIIEVRREKALCQMFSLTLNHQLCIVVEGFVVRDLIGKQAYLPRTVDVFLSYSAADKDEARAIFDILEKHGRTVFLAERSIEAGEFWEDRVKEALKNCRNFWMLVTPNSLQSEWVTTEWATAWALDKRIVPILFRCQPEELPRRLQAYQRVDFHRVEQIAESM